MKIAVLSCHKVVSLAETIQRRALSLENRNKFIVNYEETSDYILADIVSLCSYIPGYLYVQWHFNHFFFQICVENFNAN